MALTVGIVGLPNVGKSTLFNALTRAQNAAAANYPFCTIEPNQASVPVPDDRLAPLAEIVHPTRIVPATVDFFDIAGLVKGASKGEGLGNQFLANIREVNAILHVVRCFKDDDVVHVEGAINPERDLEIINTELLLADIQTVEKKLARATKFSGDPTIRRERETLEALIAHLNDGKHAADFPEPIPQDLALLTAKTQLICANVSEDYFANPSAYNIPKGAIPIAAKLEEELIGLDDAEQKEMLDSYNLKESGLNSIARAAYAALGLISYFTAGPMEVKAWTIPQGAKAPQAAGVIHTDFERGFIRAETIAYNDYITHKGEAGCRAAGLLRTEGKDYIVNDGDVMHFLFNV